MPERLQNRTIQLAHEGHPGMTKMKQRLRAKVWWPKIDAAAENCVNTGVQWYQHHHHLSR